MKTRRPLALITGASSGIGVELAKVFASEHFDLVLVARRKKLLDDLASSLARSHKTRCTVIPCDLTESGAMDRLMGSLPEHPIDVLVNNAGVLSMGEFAGLPLERQLEEIQLNVVALTSLTHRCLPAMRQRGQGRIMNLASVAAFQPVPFLAVYAATKAYVLSFSEALSEELKGSGVSCTAVCPGFTDTPMLRGRKDPQRPIPQLPLGLIADPAEVAREAFEAVMKRDVVRVPGAVYKAMSLLSRYPPRMLVRGVVGGLGRNLLKRVKPPSKDH